MATTSGRDWIFTHAFSQSSFKTYEKNGLARRDTFCCWTRCIIYPIGQDGSRGTGTALAVAIFPFMW
jgi:hypothetical protein